MIDGGKQSQACVAEMRGVTVPLPSKTGNTSMCLCDAQDTRQRTAHPPILKNPCLTAFQHLAAGYKISVDRSLKYVIQNQRFGPFLVILWSDAPITLGLRYEVSTTPCPATICSPRLSTPHCGETVFSCVRRFTVLD